MFVKSDGFDYLCAYHCTPTLVGIKCANLISLSNDKLSSMQKELKAFDIHFNKKGVYTKILCSCKNNTLILVYRDIFLKNTINIAENKKFLEELGYPVEKDLKENLDYLSLRLKKSEDFPHEIGIFLGYPFEDVVGFSDNKGKNYLFSGYWKVYSNEVHTRELFERFTRCRNNICNKINNGMNLNQIFKVA